eukprot:tig00000403_g271.t1
MRQWQPRPQQESGGLGMAMASGRAVHLPPIGDPTARTLAEHVNELAHDVTAQQQTFAAAAHSAPAVVAIAGAEALAPPAAPTAAAAGMLSDIDGVAGGGAQGPAPVLVSGSRRESVSQQAQPKARPQLSFKEIDTSSGHMVLVTWKHEGGLQLARLRARLGRGEPAPPEDADELRPPLELPLSSEALQPYAHRNRCFVLLHNGSGDPRVPWTPGELPVGS